MAECLHQLFLDGISKREVDLLRQHRHDQGLEHRGAGGKLETAKAGHQGCEQGILAGQAIERLQVQVCAKDVAKLGSKLRPVEVGSACTL